MNVLATKQRLLFVVLLVGLLQAGMASARVALPDFTELVEANAAAVVNISSSKQQSVKRRLPPGMEIPEIPEDTPFGDLLRKFFGEQGEGEHSERFQSKSLGSGFIFSQDGYVVTNHHVVQDADEIIVKLNDRREVIAEIVGTDPRSDIALLKIEAKDLPVLKIGNSDQLKPGEWVLAIGSPFGFDHSVTAGIVSAKGRSLPSENYVPFIQTDVAINPGNSGGPLFNLDGEVVGINSQIYSRTGGFMGLSFAIPIEVAMDVVEQLKTVGHVQRGWLGVYIQEVTRELAESFGMNQPMGALVANVLPDSPAQDSGIKVGDVILAYDGKDVNNSAALPPMVGRTRVGKTVKLKVMRDGSRKIIKIEIGQLPEEDSPILAGSPTPLEKTTVLGLELEKLTEKQRQEMDLDGAGLYVKRVHDGPGRRSGIKEGDVLQMINNEKISSVEQLSDIIAGLPKGKFASVLVRRSQGPEFIAIRIPK
ncbi:MAG: DegQ family serine endoprotease [Gammaproteobacteria bacterium]|nr:DegQ family serine endoprotease [Gammaproteobacteria bacterium]